MTVFSPESVRRIVTDPEVMAKLTASEDEVEFMASLGTTDIGTALRCAFVIGSRYDSTEHQRIINAARTQRIAQKDQLEAEMRDLLARSADPKFPAPGESE